MHQVQSGAATVSSSSSQASVSTNNVGAKEIGLIESVQEDSEMGWLFMIADAMSINQLSMDGAHSTKELGVDELSRAAYLMLDWCGLTRSRKSEKACVFATSEQHLLDMS